MVLRWRYLEFESLNGTEILFTGNGLKSYFCHRTSVTQSTSAPPQSLVFGYGLKPYVNRNHAVNVYLSSVRRCRGTVRELESKGEFVTRPQKAVGTPQHKFGSLPPSNRLQKSRVAAFSDFRRVLLLTQSVLPGEVQFG